MSSINNSLLTNNISSDLSERKAKKIRKDAKGNLILKKEKKKLKSKFHAHLVDNIYPGKQIANIIEVESYKKYNLDEIDNFEEEPKDLESDVKITEEKNVIKQKCCNIF